MIAALFRLLLPYAVAASSCLVVTGLGATPAFGRGGAAAAPAQEAVIPEVGGLKLGAALDLLERAGFRTARVEECTLEVTIQIHEKWGLEGSGRLDYVFQQSPTPGQSRSKDLVILLRVRGHRNHTRTVRLAVPATPPVPVALPPPPPERIPEDVPAGEPASEPPPPPAARAEKVPGDDRPAEEGRTFATGSPEAPRAAAAAQQGVVPTLLGLSLSDAEQLARDAGMTLHVNRVPGHPLGRVLEQEPSAGGRRPAAGIVLVVVTAGGDFDGERAPIAPEVYLAEIVVPGLLDRTRLQAQRIIEDLGLRWQEEEAKRGLPDRVVDQMPPAGGRVPRGGIVRIWIGPRKDKVTAPKPTSQATSQATNQPEGQPSPEALPPKKSVETAPVEPEVPAPQPPLAPGALPLGVPAPLAPGHGTVIPREDVVPIGFSWRGVKGAEAYLLEVEEEGAEGRWLANARKPARKTAVILDVERLQPRGNGRLRWRVTAVRNGRAGTPSRWVLLK